MSASIYTTNTNECRFNPVQCSWAKFETLTAQDGFVYFVTDKKKLFLGKDKQMIPMCATSGIFYGKKPIEYDNSGNKPDPKVTFLFSLDPDKTEIEGQDKPELDDLILNVGTDDYEDGCFYRVVNIVDDDIETVRLTLQGTGGSGGGPTTGGSASFTLSIIGTTAHVYSSTATKMPVTIRGRYGGTEDNGISQVTFTRRGDSEPFYIYTKDLSFNEDHTLDLYPYRDLFGSTRTTVTVAVQDWFGNERSTNFTVQIVELSLTATRDELLYSMESNYVYTCNLAGATSGVSNKKVIYTFYTEDNLVVPVIDPQVLDLSASDEGDVQKSLDLSALPHGSYVLKVDATATISASGQILPSNTLTHKIIRFAEGNTTPVFTIFVPEKTEQYTNIPLNYLLVTSEAEKEYHLNIKLNGVEKTTLTIVSNKMGTYPLYFEEKGVYSLYCNIVELALPFTTMLNIVEYTGNLPVIDPTRDDLMLYLNPKGKSNDATDRNVWADYNGRYTASLSGLHYGEVNGWMMDEDGTSYLKLSSGASLTLPDFRPFINDPTKTSTSDSRMGYGMTIEVDFEVSGVLDYDDEIIKCYSTNMDQTYIPVGFRIMGDKIQFFNSDLNNGVNSEGEPIGALLSLNIVEGKRIRVSFVIEPNTGKIEFPMCYAYLNGKLSGAVIYDKGASYKEDQPAYLSISSSKAQVKIYGIRFYSNALGDKMILNNYTSSLPTLAERQERYDSNNVFNSSGDIDYNIVSSEDYDLQIPYMVLTGGWATESKSKWQLVGQANANAGLPTGKKDYRMVDVKVVYPKNEYFKEYEDYEFKNVFASGKTMSQAYGEKPSNGGAIMYAQGTSSMEYPVKNLRLRFKNKDSWYTVRPDIAPVEIICMKADYMESSGSHNTGAANFVDALYTGVGIETPGQNHFGGDGKDTIVTCIKGHPCLIFYSPSGEKNTYEYIGKYNLNLDKATPEPFGFNHDNSNFGYLEPGQTYYAVKYNDEGDEFIGQEDPTAGGDYVAGQTETQKTVQEGEKINSIHCFEFLDNAVDVCNFLAKDGYDYNQTWYNIFQNGNDQVYGWTLGFESRYPEDRIGKHDADMLYPLAAWLNELKILYDKEIAEGKDPKKISYAYNYTVATVYQEFVAYFVRTESGDYIEAIVNESDFASGTYYTRTVASSRFEMDSLERFKREYECYLDKEFLLTYYLVTEALLMADSRVKNMMIATWGREKRSYINLNGNETYPDPYGDGHGTYIFYPIFYDMDTMLGLDNTGVYRFNYYDEDTNSSVYNGNDVLWNFVRDALTDELAPYYSELEGSILTSKDILPYFNDNQANMANEAFYNGDAMYKYVRPAREGYWDGLNEEQIDPGQAPYLYAAQGDRSLMREWFISNRMSFLRGKYNSTNYQNSDRVVFRWYYPTGEEDEFSGHEQSVTKVPPNDTFTFKSLKTGYAGVKLGANGNTYNERFDGEAEKTISIPEARNANGTEAYLLGLSTLTDLGDLSDKYMQKFIIQANDCRLENLKLGNANKYYYNPHWRPATGGQSQEITLSGCSSLKTFNLQNCSTYNNTLNFSNCPAIETVLLTGSSVTSVTFPINGTLKECRLPTTTAKIKLISHQELTDSGFSIGTYDYGSAEEIGKGNGYVNDFSNITELYVVDTPINTYPMILDSTKTLTGYYLQGFNWEITEANSMYCKVSKDEFNSSNQYYRYDQGSYISTSFQFYPSDDNIYKLVSMMNGSTIENIPVLDYLYGENRLAGATIADALSGTITINVEGTADELSLYQKYNAMYPNVNIEYGNKVSVTNAIRVSFYRIDKDALEEMGGDLVGTEPYFSTLTAPGSKTISQLIANGFSDPTKSPTNTNTYSFSGQWIDWNDSNKTIYYQDSYFTDTSSLDSSRLFSNFKPSGNDMKLVPIFIKYNRLYNVLFYDWDYVPGTTNTIISKTGEYEDYLSDIVTDPKLHYVYRPADDLSDDERYEFKGWKSETDFNNNTANPTLIDPTKVQIRSDLKYFAHYEIVNVNEVASPSILFNIKTGITVSAINSVTNQCVIELKDEYRNIVGGKITLPSSNGSGATITAIRKFENTPNLKSIHFLPSAAPVYIANSAFESSSIETMEIPDTIQIIGDKAFYNCYNLQNVLWTENSSITKIGDESLCVASINSKVVVSFLPPKLEFIGERALARGPGVTISDLPDTLTEIGTQCFLSCPNILVSKFTPRDVDVAIIGHQSFAFAGTNVTEIWIYSPWTLAALSGNEPGIFYRGYEKVTDVYVYSALITDSDEALLVDLFGESRNVTIHQIA